MTLTISQYVDPGAYIQEIIGPAGLSLATVPVLPTIIASGSRNRRATNEAVQRGLVTGEALTLAGTAPHTDDLANRGNRRVTNTTVYADGVALSDAFVSYNAASVTGTNAGTFALSGGATDAIALELDGNTAITIVFTAGAGVTTVSGTEVTVGESTIAALGTASRAEIAAAINEALNPTDSTANTAMTALGYGAAYAAAASDATTGVRITSPVATPSSDVRVFTPIAQSATTTIFGSAALDAATTIEISATVFDSGAAYTVDYIAIEDFVDTLAQTTPRTITKVGSFPAVGTFTEDRDFAVDGSYDLDWSNASATGVITNAVANGIAGTGAGTTYDLSTNDSIILAMDNRDTVTMDFIAASGPLGFIDSGSLTAAAVTPAELATQINALLANDDAYGPRYSAVADTTTDIGGNTVVRLTSPNDGSASSVAVTHPTSSDALSEIFGLSSTQTINEIGAGARPASASVYYVTYDFPRPSGDYNNPRQFFTKDQAFAFTGPLAATNPLAVAVDIAFSNGAPTVLLIQVDDTSNPGSPTRLEIQDALDAAATKSTATDIVVLDTDIGVQVDLMQHVENQSSPVEKNYRRGWFGMPRGTAIGDRDTPDTYVYRATRTLQVAADSPGRGRLVLVSSPGVEGISKTLDVEGNPKLNLDSTWLALAIACRMASFTSPAEALVRENLAKFDTSDGDFTPWVRAERAAMARDGVTVVTLDAGVFKLLDPTTTERGGGGLINFEQISASTQKDNVVRKVTQSLDTNIVGLVPTDLTDFILDIKMFIHNVLVGEIGAGAIGPYTDDAGATRPIDLQRDIVVEQDPNDPTKFFFRFFFNTRLPALRLFGEYSVGSPFV